MRQATTTLASLRRLPLLLLLAVAGDPAPAQSLPPLPPMPAAALPADASGDLSREADPLLEGALRARLFLPAGAKDAGDGTQANGGGGTEWQVARAKGIHPPCQEVGPLRYVARRIDLNGDGTPEVLTLVVGSYACGSEGCTLMIFRRGVQGYGPEGELGLFQSPLRLGTERHGGWLDLHLPGTRDGVPSGEVVLRHSDGRYRPVTSGLPAGAATDPILLELPPVPFEQVGRPLRCAP